MALQNCRCCSPSAGPAGSGADGPTHQGAFDISFLRTVPNMVVMTRPTRTECRQMLYTGYLQQRPAAVRYPWQRHRYQAESEMQALPLGRDVCRSRGQGDRHPGVRHPLQQARAAAEALDATLVDMRFVKPMDEALVLFWPPPTISSSPSKTTPSWPGGAGLR